MDHFKKTLSSSVDVIFKKFGEKGLATYVPAKGRPYRIRAVFSEQYWETDGDGISLNTRQKNIFVARADLKEDPVSGKDSVIIRGQSYLIRDPETDDAGNLILNLEAMNSKDYLSEFDTSMREDYL